VRVLRSVRAIFQPHTTRSVTDSADTRILLANVAPLVFEVNGCAALIESAIFENLHMDRGEVNGRPICGRRVAT
jgi:hypothetical protein